MLGMTRKYFLALFPFLLIIFFLSLTPVVSRDALIHHLALPKIWLEKGIFHTDSFKIFSFYPSSIHLLYYYSLMMHMEVLPKIIHASFLVLTSLLVARYIRKSLNSDFLAFLSFVITLTIPIHQRLVSEVYVDLGLLFFSTLAIISFLHWKNSGCTKRKYLYLSAVGAGLALGTKYNGIMTLIIINLFVMFAYSRVKKANFGAILYGVQFGLTALLLASPWLFRNYYASEGNPFYPLFGSIFPDNFNILEPLYATDNNTFVLRQQAGESLLDILLLPLRFFFTGEDNNFLQFDGKLNPMMIVLLPFSFLIFWKKSTSKSSLDHDYRHIDSDNKYLLIFSLFIIFATLQHSPIRTRYAISAYASLVILNVIVIGALLNAKKTYLFYVGCLCITVYVGYNVWYTTQLFERLDTYEYLTLQEKKEDYLRRKLAFYGVYEFIENHTPKDAVVYDVLCGQRSYYVSRAYMHDQQHVDTYFYNYTYEGKPPSAYLDYLRSVRSSSGHHVTHLLIRPDLFIDTFRRIFYSSEDPKGVNNKRKIENFVQFLRAQKALFHQNGAILYELNYNHKPS